MERTFALIKPRAFQNNYTGAILHRINSEGFGIAAIKSLRLSPDKAKQMYAVHRDKPFFHILVEYMTSGPIVAMILEKENAIEDFRKLIGNTDPSKAQPGTIRKDFGLDQTKNAIHASDSPENAQKEIELFFPEGSLY